MVYGGGMVHEETWYIRRDGFCEGRGNGRRDGLVRAGGEMGDGTLYRREGL